MANQPTLIERLQAACAGTPLHDPATDRWVAERRARYEAERTRDLSGIDKKALCLSLVELFQGHSRTVRTETDTGLALLVDDQGEVVDAGVDDVAVFTETWGAPVTHERAEAIAQGIRERSYRDPIRDEFERRIDRAMEIHNEVARETYELGNN